MNPLSIQASRCLAIRKRCNRGGSMNTKEREHIEFMIREYPEWYERTEEIVLRHCKCGRSGTQHMNRPVGDGFLCDECIRKLVV